MAEGDLTADRARSTASAERLRLRRSNRQAAILRAAGGEILTTGYAGASLDRIAEAVFISKATLYHYFPTKHDLYMAWVKEVHEAAQDRLQPIARNGQSPSDRLRALVVEEVNLLTTDFPDYARVLMRASDWPETLGEVIRANRQEHELLFRSVISEGLESGAFAVGNELVARYCVQGCLAYIPEWYRPGGTMAPVEVGEAIAGLVLRLLGAPTR